MNTWKRRIYAATGAAVLLAAYSAGFSDGAKGGTNQALEKQEVSIETIQDIVYEHLDNKKVGYQTEQNQKKDQIIEQLKNQVAQLEQEIDKKRSDITKYQLKVSDMEKKAQTVFDNIPQTNFKAFMGYKKITNKSSNQWKIQNLPEVYSDEKGYRRLGDDYLIAVGQAFGKSGDRLRVTMSTGKVFLATIGDSKKIVDTDDSNMQCVHNGSILEFIVDEPVFRANKEQFKEFEGSAVKIEKLGKNELARLD